MPALRRPLLALVCFLAAEGPKAGDGSPPQLEEARVLLTAGKADDALAKAREGLEYAPEDLALLEVASRAALEAGQMDLALWFAWLAPDAAGDAAAEEARAALLERSGAIDPFESRGRKLLSEHAGRLVDLGKLGAQRKLYVNAVDILARCAGSDAAPHAADELQSIYDNKRGMQALLESGVDVPLRVARRISAAKIARGDREHAPWENAWEFKGENYTVRTNIGYELGEDMLRAMEQVNQAYREVFRYRERGGGTRRCNVYVYRSRAEFDEHEGRADPSVRGFFRPDATTVHTYDPRSEGRPLAALWSTLFHEASHQFTELALPNDCPGWLNEGTASYFEGARMLPNGKLETNLIPDARLLALKDALEEGRPTLEEVVAFFAPGSYPGEYYPVGWGLVYFMKNYENAACARIYEPAYAKFMASYKGGGQHDVLARFVEYFVEGVGDPEVQSFADFQGRFKTWILDLHDLYFGPADRAERLIERARKQRAAKQHAAAVESYRWALRKSPANTVACFELAETLEAMEQTDPALLGYRRALENLRRVPEPDAAAPGFGERTAGELIEMCWERQESLDPHFTAALRAAEQSLIEGVTKAARDYSEAGYPLLALELCRAAEKRVGGLDLLGELRATISAESGADCRRWRRLDVRGELDAWEPNAAWKAVEGGVACDTERLEFFFHRPEMPERFRWEARCRATEQREGGFFGLVFGINDETAFEVLAVSLDGGAYVVRYGEEQETRMGLGQVKQEQLADLALALEIAPGGVEFFLGGKSVGRLAYEQGDVRGRIGLFTQNARVAFVEQRVLYE